MPGLQVYGSLLPGPLDALNPWTETNLPYAARTLQLMLTSVIITHI
jgi:hypothetical protein